MKSMIKKIKNVQTGKRKNTVFFFYCKEFKIGAGVQQENFGTS